jgi:hypothetical protein
LHARTVVPASGFEGNTGKNKTCYEGNNVNHKTTIEGDVIAIPPLAGEANSRSHHKPA